MKLVKSLVTLLLVVVAGFLVYFFVYQAEIDRRQREIEERSLIRFDLDKINKFTLVRPDSSVVFERGIGRVWHITDPISSEADKEPIYKLFFSLDSSDILFEVENEPEDLSVYALSNPEYCLAMEYEKNDPDTLYIGSNTPDDTMSYVRFASEGRVLAVDKKLTNLLKKPVIEYRSRSMLNVVADDILAMEITRKDKEYPSIFLTSNGPVWSISKPWEYPADDKTLGKLTEDIAETRKSTLITEKADDLSKYGLDDPSTIVHVHLKYGMPSKMILVGDKLKLKGKTHLWYAKQFDNDLIFTVETTIIRDLNRKAVFYIDKQPLKFNRNNATKIVMDTSQNPITFMRDASDNWNVVSPIDKNIEHNTINTIFTISRFLLIHDVYSFEPTPEDEKKTGLDNPRLTISFYNGETLIGEAFFGNSFTSERENTFFKTTDSPSIFVTQSTVSSSMNSVLEEVFGNE